MKISFLRALSVFIILILAACYTHEPKPKLDLEDEQIVKILVDMHIAQSATKKFPAQSRDSLNALYNAQISEVHGLEEGELDSLIAVLEEYPVYYYELNSQVLERLEDLKDIELEQDPEKKDEFDNFKN